MNQAIWAKKSATIFKFADTSVYSQAHDDIFQSNLQKQRRIWRITMDYRR